jgi:glyoxylase-like metal-dependent hydrolase (beta-lactamase superfamily II)
LTRASTLRRGDLPLSATFDVLGLSPADVVRLVIATHWDDDHIGGMGDIVEACSTARVVCSAALGMPEIGLYAMKRGVAS